MKCREFSLWVAITIFSFCHQGVSGIGTGFMSKKKVKNFKMWIYPSQERKILNSGTSLLKIYHYLLKTGIQYSLMRNSILCGTSI